MYHVGLIAIKLRWISYTDHKKVKLWLLALFVVVIVFSDFILSNPTFPQTVQLQAKVEIYESSENCQSTRWPNMKGMGFSNLL